MEKLQQIFCDVFDREDMKIFPQLSVNDVEEWDSLAHIRLILCVEKEFDIKIEIEQVESIHSVQDIMDILQQNGVDVK